MNLSIFLIFFFHLFKFTFKFSNSSSVIPKYPAVNPKTVSLASLGRGESWAVLDEFGELRDGSGGRPGGVVGVCDLGGGDLGDKGPDFG